MKQLYTIGVVLLTLIFFTGCTSQEEDELSDYELAQIRNETYILPNATNPDRKYDYYEISEGYNITHTALNVNLTDVIDQFYIEPDSTYVRKVWTEDNYYNYSIPPLSIDETIDALIYSEYNTFTQVRVQDVYKKDYGLLFRKTNYCVVTNSDDCEAYLLIRY